MKNIILSIVNIVIFIVMSNVSLSQKTLQVLSNDLSAYPAVNADYFVFSGNGLPDISNQKDDFVILDNGNETQATYQNCLSVNPSDDASILLSADLSIRNNLMDNSLDKTILMLNDIINYLNIYNVKAALHSFNNYAFLNHDFTNEQDKLLNGLNTMLFSSGSIIDTGFLSKPLGSIELLKNQKSPKTLVYFSSTHSEFDSDRIIQEANNNKIKIIPVFFGNQIPQKLYDIANATGGIVIAIADSVTELHGYALSILALSRNFEPCIISWQNELDCSDYHDIVISIPSDNIKAEFAIKINSNVKPRIFSNPGYLRFSSVKPGMSKSLNVGFTAKNGDIEISELLIQDPRFTIDSGDIAGTIILPKDSTHTLKITFTPTDSAIVFDSLQIISNACSGTTILVTGGYPNTPPKERTLTLLSPNCDDNLLVGDTAIVSWTGLLPADVIQLQYTTDMGRNWDTLATDITGLEYKWTVPDKESDSCLVRVIQLWPNNIGQTMVLKHNGGVNCANFNRDGSLVITASKDKKHLVRIWNANNGQLISELPGHTKDINWVNFDMQDKYAVSAGDDSSAIIWDVKKGEIVRELNGHRDVVRSANFSPSGKYIVTASNDGQGYVWDVETGLIIDSSYTTGFPLWFACFSPDEKYILVTDNSGHTSAIEFGNQSNFKKFDSDLGVISFATFNHDMTKIATASWFGKATVWDFNSGIELFSITHDTNKIIPINSCDFDNTGQLLLTAGVDTVPRLWNANTGTAIATLLNEHTSSVQIASFNFDGTRILTASWDSTAKVWNREQIGLQVDTSDCAFSISNIKIQAEDIVFSDTPLGTIKDTLVIPFIMNELDFPLLLKDYSITGINSGEFEVINNLPPLFIDSLGETHIEVRFKPSALGVRRAVLEMYFPGKTLNINLIGQAIEGPLELLTDIVDFGLVEIGDYKDTTITGMITNNTGASIRIDSVAVLGPDFFHFNILNDLRGSVLNPGDRIDLTLRFTPENTASLNSLFRIHHSSSQFPLNLSTFGKGIQPRIDTASILIDNAVGVPGETINVPIRIANLSSRGIAPSITGFRIVVEFNSTLLEPLETSNNPIDIINGFRTIQVELPSTFDSDSVLSNLTFLVGLGNDTSTVLKIQEISLLGEGKMVLTGKDGQFELLGICKSGGNRLFESEGRISLSSNVPNPAVENTDITFEIIENGLTEIVLYDVLGNKIRTFLSSYLRPGIYTYSLNVTDLPSGKIFYVLRTPTKTLVKSMDVIK